MSEEMLEYLQRVRTYKLGKWLYRSHRLSPYVLASHGFRAASDSLAECHICQAQVDFSGLSLDESNEQLEHELEQRLTQHKQDCPYGQSEELLYRLTREQLYSDMDDILQRCIDSYKFYKGRLPFITEELWNRYFGNVESLFAKLSDRFNEGKQISLPQVLSICGWHLQQDGGKACLECLFCGRNVAIDKYACTDQHQQKIINDRMLQNNEKPFDPIEQHRYFCFWGNFDSKELVQNPSLYGWQLCLRHLQDKSLEVDRGWARANKFEEVAKAKQQFNKLLDSFTNRTRDNMKKFDELLTESRELFLDEGSRKAFEERADNTRRSLQGIMHELGEVRADPKKVKRN